MIKQIKLLIYSSLLLALMVPIATAEPSKAAPSTCSLTALDGSTVDNLKKLQGKVIYVDFWASWCPPCVRSFPFMSQLDQDLKDQGLQVIGINLDEEVDDAKSFLDKHRVDFTIALDTSKQCAKDFGVIAMPSTYIIDRKGTIRHVHRGFRSEDTKDLRLAIEHLLTEPL